jgi:hypothetical protein
MNRRTTLLLAVTTVMALPVLPEIGFAQSDPFLGVWQLNLAKSKYSPGPPPKSQTWYFFEDEGIRKNSQVTIRADGVPNAAVFTHIYDDQPRSVPGAQGYDASAYARIDARTIKARYLQVGKVLQIATMSISQDGKTLTYTATGTDANGRQVNILRVYDKQQ